MPQPNIILIVADQWRGDCLSIAGHTGVDTPNLDCLARQGTIFNHAYSSCPSCIAARASLFTGLSPNSHGRIGYKDEVEWNYENMLPQVLSDAGYQTHDKAPEGGSSCNKPITPLQFLQAGSRQKKG